MYANFDYKMTIFDLERQSLPIKVQCQNFTGVRYMCHSYVTSDITTLLAMSHFTINAYQNDIILSKETYTLIFNMLILEFERISLSWHE